MKLVKFFKNENGSNSIVVSQPVVDEYTGVVVEKRQSFVFAGSYFFTPFIGKEVELTLVHSPKLNKDVCTGIKVASATKVKGM